MSLGYVEHKNQKCTAHAFGAAILGGLSLACSPTAAGRHLLGACLCARPAVTIVEHARSEVAPFAGYWLTTGAPTLTANRLQRT